MYPGVAVPQSGRLAALFRVPIDYVLEVRVDGQVAVAVSVPNYPGGLSLSQPHATSVRHTLGDEPVREATVNRFRTIVIRGNSGFRARAGYNERGEVIFAEGPIILREFQAFLDAYQKLVAEDGPRVTLVFRAFAENYNYRCEIETWAVERDAATTPLANWSLTLRAYLDAPPNNPINLLSPVSDWFEKAAQKIQLANAYIAIAGNATTNFRGDLESLRAPGRALQQTALALQNVADGARAIARFPADMVADFANAAQGFKDAYEDVVGGRFDDPWVNEWEALSGEWERLTNTLGITAEDAPRDSMTALGYSGGTAADLEMSRARALAVGPLDGLYLRAPTRGPRLDAQEATPVQLRTGENLRDVALRILGDAEQWIVIAEYNGWQNAHRLGSGRPARRGDWVRVPRGRRSETLLRRSDPYMRDLYLDAEGDLELVGQGGTTGFLMDLRTVRGPANLRQALTGRMLTVMGESAGFPQYGLPRVVGLGGSASGAAYIAAHVRDQLLRDPRVDLVQNLSVTDEGDTLTAEADVTPKDATGSPVTLLAPLPSAA